MRLPHGLALGALLLSACTHTEDACEPMTVTVIPLEPVAGGGEPPRVTAEMCLEFNPPRLPADRTPQPY